MDEAKNYTGELDVSANDGLVEGQHSAETEIPSAASTKDRVKGWFDGVVCKLEGLDQKGMILFGLGVVAVSGAIGFVGYKLQDNAKNSENFGFAEIAQTVVGIPVAALAVGAILLFGGATVVNVRDYIRGKR